MSQGTALADPARACYSPRVIEPVRARALSAVLALASGALACRPPAPPPEPARPLPPLFVATGDRIYTNAPVGEGVSFVPVTEKLVHRRAGAVEVDLRYPEVDLPDDAIERELAAAIAEAGGLKRWTDEDGEGLRGRVAVDCEVGVATTTIVSVVCRVLDASAPADDERPAPAGPAATARTYHVEGGSLRPLALSRQLRPGAGVEEVVRAALLGADPEVQSAWLSGQCSAGEPDFSLELDGLALWPDTLAPPCEALRLPAERLEGFVVPNGFVARLLRATARARGVEPEPASEEPAPP